MTTDDLAAFSKRLRALGNELQQAAADLDGAGSDGMESAREMVEGVLMRLPKLRADLKQADGVL